MSRRFVLQPSCLNRRVAAAKRQGFFYEHVALCRERLERQARMGVRRRGNDHRGDGRVVQHLGELLGKDGSIWQRLVGREAVEPSVTQRHDSCPVNLRECLHEVRTP